MEGITFSLHESIELFAKRKISSYCCFYWWGAKNDTWLQMQADIFNTRVIKLENEQGPAMGAAMLAAFGSGWFESLEECAEQFIREAAAFYPKAQNVQKYKTLFDLYKNIYTHTKGSQYSFEELSKN